MSNKGLSKLLLRDHPKLYTANSAHVHIRRYRGRVVRSSGGNYISHENVVPCTHQTAPRMPTSAAAEWAPVHVPASCKSTLILADAHVPYHDEAAIDIALRHSRENHDIDSIIYNGDTHDCYHLSRFEKDPETRSFPEELENTKALLDYVGATVKPKWTAYKCGNHEARFESYLRIKAPELIGTREFSLRVLYGLHERKTEWVDSIIPIRIGHLWIIHGHECGRGANSPVNPARGVFLKANDIVLEGHFHRSSHHSDTMLRGTMLSCWSVGCLCAMHPEYAPINRWNQGFAVVNRTDNEGNFTVYNYKIINRKMVVNA